ncbi:hypothetical protein K470DRAFT_265898 [Piedraia hortae CBS 480.64]|uniref:Lysophospholipase n=1 Tax=Piedraia hortae CBS 480.64 TaxID=1314780 RepID=A0A6A7BUC8_9PEZI|nr:hypothetical protein K470DRAFT_265898 [Piedraia hortae CBS 480.64]
MKCWELFVFLGFANCFQSAVAAVIVERALPANSPYGYTPHKTKCPSNRPVVRDASKLSSEETEWLKARRKATLGPLQNLLKRMNITGLDADTYISNHQNNESALPTISIALSGGGYRALLNGAGVLEAFDSRTINSTGHGQLGGLLQSATYLAGLSGGNWLVGSLYANNYTSVYDILHSTNDRSNLWQFENPVYEGPAAGRLQILTSIGYYKALEQSVQAKSRADFNVTITDYWGRALSYQLINDTDGGPAYTMSSIADQGWFTSGNAPLPLIVAGSRKPGELTVSTNSSVFVFDPWEMGSFDPTIYGFAPLKYVGSNFTNGRLDPNTDCVTGFDNLGFIMGTSSSLFNYLLTSVNSSENSSALSSAFQSVLTSLLDKLGSKNRDIADWVNPFYHYQDGSNPYAASEQLSLVDGGEDLQNIPLNPLIQPQRAVDVIFAVDSSADTNTTYPTRNSSAGWPDGGSLIATYARSLTPIQNGTAFPSIPDANTFINLGLSSRPTFFGCDVHNLTGPSPLIVYLPNGPYTYYSNISTSVSQLNSTVRDAMVLNGYNGATQGNGTLDDKWPACVGCAILSRSMNRTGTKVPSICTDCFDRYCWNGTVASHAPGNFNPSLKVNGSHATSDSNIRSVPYEAAMGAFLTVGSFLML